MKYGYFDVRDQCWIGTETGPMSVDDENLAKAGATILTERFDRLIQARPLPETTWKYKDEITPNHSLQHALKKLYRTGN